MNNGMTTQQTTQAQTLRSDLQAACDAASPVDGDGRYETASLDALTITWCEHGRTETVAWLEDGAVHLEADAADDHPELVDRLEATDVPVGIHGDWNDQVERDLDKAADAIETLGYDTSIDSGEITVREPGGGRCLVRLNRTWNEALVHSMLSADLSRVIDEYGWSTPLVDMGDDLDRETVYEVDSADGVLILRDAGQLIAVACPRSRQINLDPQATDVDVERLHEFGQEHGATVVESSAPGRVHAAAAE